MIGRLTHYAVDAVLVSTLLAGVRRSSGFRPQTDSISDATTRSLVEQYLGIGEKVFDVAQATIVNSAYFKRDA
ncbi:DUF1748-domain-containing protein [Dentipellis sp. KUC8613]|nr:DUF1748-domain-containing protein [Dentipellis sp. KUC8613]